MPYVRDILHILITCPHLVWGCSWFVEKVTRDIRQWAHQLIQNFCYAPGGAFWVMHPWLSDGGDDGSHYRQESHEC